MTVDTDFQLPLIIAEVEVSAVERVSTSFVRVELGGPELADFGVDGPLYDQRIKIVFPSSDVLPTFSTGPDWYSSWLEKPDEERGSMRTYTIREVRGSGADTRLVVDFVLHVADGHSGPGSSWAASARPGDRVLVTAPRRGFDYGGIEFAPGSAGELLLVGDETAVPAICSILRDLHPSARGAAFLEVPTSEDVCEVTGPPGVRVTWLPRDGAERGVRQIEAVRRHLGLPASVDLVDETVVDPDLWDTPTHSTVEEPVPSAPTPRSAEALADVYAWIAGESRVVTTLRRCMVKELGMQRHQVAFMGYWREGVAMKS
jgi:NADPH-dependent ferric siderophore reductase